MTVGVSGSGKTTWAKSMVASDGNCVNINKDDLREMLHNSVHSKGRESLVIKVQEAIVGLALEAGNDVIISDTNLNPANIERIKNKFSDKADVVIKDFTDVPLKTCIERDSKRSKPVGEKVIKDQYRRYIKKEPNVLDQDKSLPKAVIFDLDGTIFEKSKERGYYDWNKVALDTPKEYVVNLLKMYQENGYKIILLSGRDEAARSGTIECLSKYSINYEVLHMRQHNDMRSDDIVKKEIFEREIKNKYYIESVTDDRPKVLRLWFEIGLNVFSVNHPDNEF